MENYQQIRLLAFSFILLFVKGGCKQNICTQIWANNKAEENVVFSMYENQTVSSEVFISNWQWSGSLNEKWSLYYKEWPRKGILSGGFVLSKNHKMILAKLSWKVRNGILLWTTTYRKPYVASWNGTICKLNVPIRLASTKRGWTFQLGEVLITGGKSGKKNLNSTSPLFMKGKRQSNSMERRKREAEDMEGDKKETVFNKIKGWFRELLDQGESDNRGWLTRLGDWVLGFLERVLSR